MTVGEAMVTALVPIGLALLMAGLALDDGGVDLRRGDHLIAAGGVAATTTLMALGISVLSLPISFAVIPAVILVRRRRQVIPEIAEPERMRITDLSLPEGHVLLHGERADPHAVVYLALLDLVASRAAVLSGEGDLIGLRLVDPIDDLSPPIATLAQVLFQGGLPGVTCRPRVTDVQARFKQRWIDALHYVRWDVWDALTAEGLSDLGPSYTRSLRLTARGRRFRSDLRAEVGRLKGRSDENVGLMRAVGLDVPTTLIRQALIEIESAITPPDAPQDSAWV